MKLAQLLFKPKWQDKRVDVRRQAVIAGNEPDLLAALPQLVRADPDPGVRLAALKRVNEYEIWRERSTADADGEVRLAARGAYMALLCSRDVAVPAMPRRIAELDTLSAGEIEKVAISAPESELRAAALMRVTRAALLADAVVTDADPKLRLATLERIHDVAALERIAERARKTDKTISRRARELIELSRVGSGDVAALADRARVLCERLETLIRAPDAATEEKHAAIDVEWRTLGERTPSEFVARYEGADRLIRRVIEAAKKPVVAKVFSPDVATTPAASITEEQAAAARPATVGLEVLASQARFDAALSMAAADAQREREQRRAMVAELEALTPTYVSAIESGDISAAHALHGQVDALSATIGTLPATVERRIGDTRARYAELKRWQLWSNQQRRDALCTEIEALAGSGQHPDAVATRVRAARDEWKKLDVSEGIAASDAGGMTRRFQTLCHRALRPTKAYFDKRDELRTSRKDEIELLLVRANEPAGEREEWLPLTTLRQELSTALRSLDAIDPRERTVTAKRIKDAMAAISSRIEAIEQAVDKTKRRLIERAAALSQTLDQRSAARDTRELQQQWKAAGNGRRSADQRLWQEFRIACDAVFQKLDSAREQRDSQVAAVRTRVQELLAETEAFAAEGLLGSADAAKARLRDLDARWQALSSDDRAAEQRYRRSRDAIAMTLKDDARRKRLSRYDGALEKYTLLHRFETRNITVDALTSQWTAGAPAHGEFASSLQARYQRAISPENPGAEDETDTDAARQLLIQLEYLGGLESPPEDRALRMTQQVQRLSTRLRDGAAATPEGELGALLNSWFAQAPQTEDLEARFLRTAVAAIATLP